MHEGVGHAVAVCKVHRLHACGGASHQGDLLHCEVDRHALPGHQQHALALRGVQRAQQAVVALEGDGGVAALAHVQVGERCALDHAARGGKQHLAAPVACRKHAHQLFVLLQTRQQSSRRQSTLLGARLGNLVHAHGVAVAQVGEEQQLFVAHAFDDPARRIVELAAGYGLLAGLGGHALDEAVAGQQHAHLVRLRDLLLDHQRVEAGHDLGAPRVGVPLSHLQQLLLDDVHQLFLASKDRLVARDFLA